MLQFSLIQVIKTTNHEQVLMTTEKLYTDKANKN